MTRLALALALACALPAAAQTAPRPLRLSGPGRGAPLAAEVAFHRGYAAVPFRTLERLGWTVALGSEGGEARRGAAVVRVRERSPFFRWDAALLQLSAEPYRMGDALWVPLQLLSDFLPERMPEDYAFRPQGPTLEALVAGAWTPAGVPTAEVHEGAASPAPASPASVPPVRVVVIDPGHGGEDPGARGSGGTREKEVALRLGLALARELERRPDLEVHLTRDGDRLVPLWERGSRATELKGDRPGIFISLHANAGDSRAARGFETYFLSEARTEHERRVAELENAPLRLESGAAALEQDPGLGFILKELRSLDHQHWSSLLAEFVQEELDPVHPGPNRGVKQGPLAVITNALMPAVLVEIGFISHRAEETLLADADFQDRAARAIAAAVDRFFERYPPGTGGGG